VLVVVAQVVMVEHQRQIHQTAARAVLASNGRPDRAFITVGVAEVLALLPHQLAQEVTESVVTGLFTAHLQGI
jgi:hypothetical protein